MRKVFVIRIGAGNPDYVTVQAINALDEVNFFHHGQRYEKKTLSA
jgi:precorrin-6A synthase